jgi:hypothetical protein
VRKIYMPWERFGDLDFAEDDAYLDLDWSLAERFQDAGNGDFRQLLVSHSGTVGGRIQTSYLAPLGKRCQYEPGFLRRGSPVMNPYGYINHWTAGHNALRICVNGRSDVPGPLCHHYFARSGIMTMVATGRANHAGRGHQALVAEMKKGRIDLRTAKQRGLADTGGSGGSFVGGEIEHRGDNTPMPAAQVATLIDHHALLVTFMQWNVERVTGDHAWWTSRKVDVRDLPAGKGKRFGMPPLTSSTRPTGEIMAEMVTARLPWARQQLKVRAA